MSKRGSVENQTIKGETGHKYFHMMLNMADDDLDTKEYRLLGHYLRWAGHGGTHEEGIRKTATVCHMGVSTVEKTRDQLVQKGYLKVEKPSEDERKAGLPTAITVIDRWAENIARYSPTPNDEGSIPNQEHPVPEQVDLEAKGIPKQVHPPVPKQVHIEEPIEEPTTRTKNKEKDSAQSAGEAPSASSKKKKDNVLYPMFQALVAAFAYNEADMGSAEKSMLFGVAKDLAERGNPVTPEEVPALFDYVKKASQSGGWQLTPNSLKTRVAKWRKTLRPPTASPATAPSRAPEDNDPYNPADFPEDIQAAINGLVANWTSHSKAKQTT